MRATTATWTASAAATLLALLACSGGDPERQDGLPAPGPAFASERAPDLGPDDAPVSSIRVTVETGTRNGAGTDNDVVIWFDNRRNDLSQHPSEDFAPGRRASATFTGSSLPRTLGALRRASIVLTLQVERADIASSWYCDRATVEVRLEGNEQYATYLESREVGWLSQDEPPRRSNAYALQ